jgi:hypothetical protein
MICSEMERRRRKGNKGILFKAIKKREIPV